jgi:ABC-2 type transport system permease protein
MLYGKVIYMNYKSRLKYHGKKEFFHTLGMFLSYGADIFVIWMSMGLFKSLGGFNFSEVMFLFSIELLAYSLTNSVVWFVSDTYNLIVRGTLDGFLTKPVNPFVLISAKYYEIGYLGQFAVSITLLYLSLKNLAITWGSFEWILYIVLLLNSTFIYIGFTTIPALLAFWWGNTEKLTSIFRWSFKQVIQYPISIYPQPIRVILTVILPYALINYYPSLVLLKKTKLLLSIWIVSLLLAVGFSLLLIIRIMWYKGLKAYESSGG